MLFAVSNVSAQNYVQAVGLRGGVYSGINYKNFVTNSMAIEGIFLKPWKAVELIGLVEYHNYLSRSNHLLWYYGFGGHIGFYDALYTLHSRGTYLVLGVDGILGLEYEFDRIPLAIGVDWKPNFNLVGISGFSGDGGAFSLRYTFN